MADIALDLNKASLTYKDWLTLNNDLALTSDAQANSPTNNILQNILQRLSFFFGEWFLDNTQGLPWIQQVFVKSPDLSKVDALIRNMILGTPGVITLLDFSMDINTAARVLTVDFQAQTTSGIVNYSGSIPSGIVPVAGVGQ